MASGLLQAKTGDSNVAIGKRWTERFLKRNGQLETAYSRALDNNRAKATHPGTIRRWFDLLASVVKEYEILPENVYNFDEKGVLMGMASGTKVITKIKDKRRFKTQPGNRELVTIIEAVNSMGWAIPPTLVFKAKHQQSSWWEQDIVRDTKIAVSPRGWTDSELAVEWLTEVFDPSTKEVTNGTTYRLLVLDGHDSHVTWQFVMACHARRILPLCLPPHTTHLLQPLDIAIFGSLQKAYGDLVTQKCENGVDSINKDLFISLYIEAREHTFRPTVIQAGFRATGLIPLDPQQVFKRLPQEERSTTPELLPKLLPDSSKTPKTAQQVRHQIEQFGTRSGRSPLLRKLEKGFAKVYADNILLNQQNRLLFSENRVRKLRKSTSKRLLSNDGRLMTKESAAMQQLMASNEQREQIRKTRYRIAKKEYQEYLREKNPHRKTLPKHKFVILPICHDSPEVSDDSEEGYDAPEDDIYERSSDIELEDSEASDEEMDEDN